MTTPRNSPSVRVLVTGADGFIGRETMACLSSAAPAVEAIPLDGTVDVRDRDAVTRHLTDQRPDVVVHLAAVSGAMLFTDQPEVVAAVNTVGTVNVFEAARCAGVSRVVYASSVAVIETAPDSAEPPRSLYGATKQFGETVATLYRHDHGLVSTCLRIGSVYGAERSTSDVLSAMIGEARETGTITYDPRGVEPLIEVRDAGRYISAVARLRSPRSHYDLVGYVKSHEEIASELASVLGCAAESADRTPGRASHWAMPFDSWTVTHDTGVRPSVGFEDGMAAYVRGVLGRDQPRHGSSTQ